MSSKKQVEFKPLLNLDNAEHVGASSVSRKSRIFLAGLLCISSFTLGRLSMNEFRSDDQISSISTSTRVKQNSPELDNNVAQQQEAKFHADTYEPVHLGNTLSTSSYKEHLDKCLWNTMPFPFASSQIDLSLSGIPTKYKMMLHHPEDDGIVSASFLRNHGNEGFENHNKQKYATKLRPSSGPVPKDPLIVDIGANIGIHTLWFAAAGFRTHAFEPVVTNYALLHCSAMVNPPMHKNLWINHLGLSDSFKENVCMNFDRTNQGHAYIDDSANGCQDNSVTLVTLDWYWERVLKKEQIYMMKIDVEGFEPVVFNGAPKMMARKPPMVIHMEYSPEMMSKYGNSGPNFLKSLVALGYKWIEGSGGIQSYEHALSLTNGIYDVVFIHEKTERDFVEGRVNF